MDTIEKTVKLSISQENAFNKFVYELNKWWPKIYTWSNETLNDIFITPKIGGLCTEIGPNEFRIDWGTVVDFKKDELLSLKWQIGSNRDPIPNLTKASLVTVKFLSDSSTETVIELSHTEFKNHGDKYLEYLKAMDSEHGWEYLLNCYKNYAEK